VGTRQGDEMGGVSLSADGTVVAFGSPYYDVNSSGSGTNEGRVRIYKYNSGTDWTWRGDIIGALDERVQYNSLSADGTVVAVGGWNYSGQKGRVRVYKYNSGTDWTYRGEFVGTQTQETCSVVSLSADGTVVAVGSPGYDSSSGTIDVGRVRIYKYNSGTDWTYRGELAGLYYEEKAGTSISLSADGTVVAIGHPFYTIPAVAGGAGRVRIYKYNSGTDWTWRGDLTGTNQNENYGYSISISADGSLIAIGAPYIYGGQSEGRVHIYKYNSGTDWTKREEITGTQLNERCGSSVSLSADGTAVAVGSYEYDNNTTGSNTVDGRVRIFSLSKQQSIYALAFIMRVA
jgi:hypothetical protein